MGISFNTDRVLALAEKVGIVLLKELLILLIGFFVIKYLLKAVGATFEKAKKLDPMLYTFFNNALKIVFWTALILIMLKTAGVDVTSFLAIFAAAGAAIALALKDSLGNFAGGILLMVTRPFSKGDYIECSGQGGVVESIDLLYTTIVSYDNKTITLPNGQVANSCVVNFSNRGERRIDLTVGISYESDIETAKKVLLDLADKDPRVLKDKSNLCAVTEYADSAIILAYKIWVKSEDYWDVYFSINDQIKRELTDAGISIPFPQCDVHLDQPK